MGEWRKLPKDDGDESIKNGLIAWGEIDVGFWERRNVSSLYSPLE